MNTERRWSHQSSSSVQDEATKFPDLEPTPSRDYLATHEEEGDRQRNKRRSPSPHSWSALNGGQRNDRWQAKKDHHIAWSNGHLSGTPSKHGRQKSISEAIKTIRTRKGSVSANAAELADALKAPVSVRLIVGLISKPESSLADMFAASLPRLVHELGTHEYIFEDYSQRFSSASYADRNSIRMRLVLVSRLSRFWKTFPTIAEGHPNSQARYPLPHS